MVLTAVLRRFQTSGTTTTLPAALESSVARFTLASHITYGAVLDSVENLSQPFTWLARPAPLWTLRVQPQSDWGDDWSGDWGGGFVDVAPNTGVVASRTTDVDGRDALTLRWTSVPLPSGGAVEVLVIAALGADEQLSRWRGAVRRLDAESTDGIERLTLPAFAVDGPVAARAGETHIDSQQRARHLLPAAAVPALGSETVPLTTFLEGVVETEHPFTTGAAVQQPLAFESVVALDPQDAASLGQMLLFGAIDPAGWPKRFSRGASTLGDRLVLSLEHAFVPRWATHPFISPEASSSQERGEFYSEYEVVLGPAWTDRVSDWTGVASRVYRDATSATDPTPRTTDPERTDVSRAEVPVLAAVDQQMNLPSRLAGAVLTSWGEELRSIASADRVIVQVGDLAPDRTQIAPPVDFSRLRGVNYLPSCATWSDSLHLGWIPFSAGGDRPQTNVDGYFHLPFFSAEMDILEDVGFTNLRCWLSFLSWCADRSGFMRTLKDMCVDLRARGMTMTAVLWSPIPAGFATAPGTSSQFILALSSYDPATVKANLWSVSAAWQVSGAPPGRPAGEVDLTHFPEPAAGSGLLELGEFGFWTDTRTQKLVSGYLQDVAQFFADDADGQAVFLSYELFNEANVLYSGSALKRQRALDLIAQTWSLLRLHHPSMRSTVGWAGAAAGLTTELARRGVALDYLSAHGYAFNANDEDFAAIEANIMACKSEADALSLPLVFSEFYVVPENNGQMQRYLDILSRAGAGGQVWSFLGNNAWRRRGEPFSDTVEFDGIRRHVTPATSITRSMVGIDFGDDWGDDWGGPGLVFAKRYPADEDALRAWCAT